MDILSCSLNRTMPKKRRGLDFFNNIILEHLSIYSYLDLSSGWWHLRSIQSKQHPKTHDVVFVCERLPSLCGRTYLGNKAALMALWIWKFHFYCGKLWVVWEVAATKWSCRISWCPPLRCCPLTQTHLLSVCPSSTGSKLPCLGMDTNIHQSCWGLACCHGRSSRWARRASSLFF